MAEDDSGTRLISQKGTKMTHIPAKVLNVHKLYNEYLVTVVGHIERQKPQSERFGLSEFPNYALRMAADHGEFTFRSPDQPMQICGLRRYSCGKATGRKPPTVVEALGIGFNYKREEAFAQSG